MSQRPYPGKEMKSLRLTLRLTREGGTALALGLILSAVGITLKRYDFLTLGLFISSALTTDMLILYLATLGSSAAVKRITYPSRIVLGSEGFFKTLASVKGLKWLEAILNEEIPGDAEVVSGETAVEGPSTLVLTYSVRPARRGPHRFGPLHLRVPSPLKFAFIEYFLVGNAGVEVDVVPTFYAEELRIPPQMSSTQMPGTHQVKVSGGYGDFIKLREYVPGDDVRLIYWPATAKNVRGTPIVKELMIDTLMEVFIVVDPSIHTYIDCCGRRIIDEFVDSAGGLLTYALRKGDPAGLYITGSPAYALPPTRRKEYIYSALKVLEALMPSKGVRLSVLPDIAGRMLRRGTRILIFSTLAYLRADEVADVCRSLSSLGMTSIFIVPDMVHYVRRRLSEEALALIEDSMEEYKNRMEKLRYAVTSSGSALILAPPGMMKALSLKAYVGDASWLDLTHLA